MRKASLRGIGPLALLLTFLSCLGSRLESWGEVVAVCAVLNFVIIGPLWAAVAYFSFARRSKTAIVLTVVVYLVSASLLSLWHVAAFEARLAAVRMCCDNNLKQIGLALRQYKQHYGCLPPAYISDAKGKPMHSWRVLLLPFLDQDALYRQYSFKEPWDGPNNRKLHDVGVAMYRCPNDSGDYANTSYAAVVGTGVAWPCASSTRTSDMRDIPAKTILVVEVADSGINWMDPRDISFDHMDFHINGEPRNSISSAHPDSASALFADGSVRYLNQNLTPEAVRALLTIAGGQNIPQEVP